MSGATASLPDLHLATDASLNAQAGLSGFLKFTASLSSGADDSTLHDITEALCRLDGVLDIDVSGLSERLPQALTTIENALPADTLRFVEEIQDAYQEVSDFLSNSELVRQIRPGSNLEQTALAMVDDILSVFHTRLASIGSSLFDVKTLERVKTALSTIETLASGSSIPPEQLQEFLAQNLLGIASNFLTGASSHLQGSLAILEPFSGASLEERVAASRDALTTAFQAAANALHTFDPADLSQYAALELQLQTLSDVQEAAFSVLDGLYAALTTAVAAPAWDALLENYATVLSSVRLVDDLPSVDDAVDAIAGTVESFLSRLSMSLSPEELSAQVARVSGTIHDLFTTSPLSQVRQILIDFIGKVETALEGIPSEEVQRAVEGMLARVHQELQALRIDQIRTGIENAFKAAHEFVDENLGADLLSGVSDALTAAIEQFKSIPIAELGQTLATAVDDAGQVIQDLETNIASGIEEVETLLANLDRVDFRPVSDEVVDEIHALEAKLSAIEPEALSDVERVAIQAALSILRAVDLEGIIVKELERGFETLDVELTTGVQSILDAWLEFRRRIGGLDAAALAAAVTGLLDQAGKAVQGVSGSLAVAPLQKLIAELLAKLQLLSPQALLDPLQAPYDRILHTIQRANPDVWTEPLRALHAEIERLINLVDITPLLSSLEQKQKDLFAQAQQVVIASLDAVHVPAPLDAFYAQMKALVLGLTGAIFGDPDGALRQFHLSLSQSVRPSTLFQPLDLAFDRLMAAVDTLPPERVLAALQAIHQAIGVALPALNPANILRSMREAQGRLAAVSPGALPGVVSLPGFRLRLVARLSESTDHSDAKASLLARLDLVIAPLDVSLADSRLQRLSTAHQALVTRLRQRINVLDTSAAQTEFQRLNAGLRRILPAFLYQAAPLDLPSIRAGLASLRPSTKARRIDLAVDRFLAQLVPLESALSAATGGFFEEIRNAALLLHPGSLKASVAEVYATLRAKLRVLDPDELAASLRTNVWEPLMDPLQAIHPSSLKVRLQGLFQQLIDKLTGSVNDLLDQVRKAIDAFLLQIKQALSQVLGALNSQLAATITQVGELLARLDHLLVDDLFGRLLKLLGNLKTSFNQELERVRNEFDVMLDAIPLNASASAAVA